ncbi:MAG: hypothetical protein P1U90_13695 [Akkermansiaceae bacterium]|nr:hypothetical protein [Akkermansiaceae bacterium]
MFKRAQQMPGPPPIPSQAPKSSRRRTALIVIGVTLGSLVLLVGAGFLFVFTARDFEPDAAQKDSILTVDHAADFSWIDPSTGTEEWECEKYLDGSIQISYLYSDELISLNCTVTVERKSSDVLASYLAEWSALKLGNRLSGVDVSLEEANHVFSWGDQSKFAFQVIENERSGFAFITRKDKKIYFVNAWGLNLEDADEIAALLKPKLELFAAEPYLR